VRAALTLTEIYANPPGDEAVGEWIELYNPANASESTIGYVLKDTMGVVKQFSLPIATVSAKSYFLIWRASSAISLNNDGEEVVLVNPTGASESSGFFITAEGKSWTKSGGKWLEALPTPGFALESTELSTPSAASSAGLMPISTVMIASSPSGILVGADVTASQSSLAGSQFRSSPMVSVSEVAACASPMEWVELEVSGLGLPGSLTGWSLQDGSGNSHDLSSISVNSSGFIVLEWKSGWLTNSGETFSLHRDGMLIEEVKLPACVLGQSYQRLPEGWKISSFPSPGLQNESTGAQDSSVRLVEPSVPASVKNSVIELGLRDPFASEMPKFEEKQSSTVFFSFPKDFRTSLAGQTESSRAFNARKAKKVAGVAVIPSRAKEIELWSTVALVFVLLGQIPLWWQSRDWVLETARESLGLALPMLRR